MFRSLKSEAELLLPSTHEVPCGLQERILGMMNRDEFSILARNDQLNYIIWREVVSKTWPP